jgi:hypothetical protein
MKISRRMRLNVEGKIRHGLATGALPIVERTTTTETPTRPAEKSGPETDQAK